MKLSNIVFGSLLGFSLILSGCESSTKYGDCVGLGEKQNPKLHYKVSTGNLLIGVLFFEIIVPPIIVITDEIYCPVGVEENESH